METPFHPTEMPQKYPASFYVLLAMIIVLGIVCVGITFATAEDTTTPCMIHRHSLKTPFD